MKSNFDTKVNRLGTDSTKWDRYLIRDNLTDIVPLWVADMDFATVPEVTNAIIKRATHPIYAYTDANESVFNSIINWEQRQHNISITKENIILNTGVVYGLYEVIPMLLSKNEKVIVQPPVYPPLFNTPKSLGYEVVYNDLIHNDDGSYSLDINDFEAKLINDPSIKLYIMCNPHNPTGHCYTLEEINSLFKICHKHNIWIISDEIHADIIMPGQKHFSALLSDSIYHEKLIVLGSPTKTFNLAGLKISYAITKNLILAKQFTAKAKACGLSSINIFALEAIKASYTYGDSWLLECRKYIYNNFLYLKDFLDSYLPSVKFNIPEATYLGWLDLSNLNLPENYVQRLKYEAKVEFQGGSGFNEKYHKFIRINVACHRSTLTEGLNRLYNWLKLNKLI